jgi:selenocysteine lyase/cysteine desulfurase
VIKARPHSREGLRASMAFFLLEDEIDKLLEALGSLAERRR